MVPCGFFIFPSFPLSPLCRRRYNPPWQEMHPRVPSPYSTTDHRRAAGPQGSGISFMDTNRNPDDAVTASRPAGADKSQQLTDRLAAADGEQPVDVVMPAAPGALAAKGHPPAIWFFFWGEFAERSSYYGMRAILFLYMTSVLHWSDGYATPVYSAFKMACYFLPLVGGFIADRWLGRYWTIVGFSVPYVAGHFILGYPVEPALFIALGLLAGGSGVIKPNISTLMGQTYDQKRPGQEQLRSAAFLWFYLSINIGALISQLALPMIRNQYVYYHLPPEVRARADGKIQEGKDIADLATPLMRQQYLVAALPERLRYRAEAAADRGEDLLTELSRNDASAFATMVLQDQPLAAAGCTSYALTDSATNTSPEVRAENDASAFATMVLQDQPLAAAGCTSYVLTDSVGAVSPEVQAKAQKAARQGEEAATSILQTAYAIAFQFPAWLMVLSLAVFAAGKPFYAKEKREHHVLTPEERRLQWQTLGRLFGIFALIVLFWFGYEHNDTLWIAFTRDYVDLRVPLLNMTIAPDQLQFLNALFVIILVPTFNIVFSRLDPKVKVFTPMRKILAGFLLTAAAVGIMALAGFLVEGHTQQVVQDGKAVQVATEKVSVLWPAAAVIVLTFGEVLLYGTMLELAYAAAPKSMKGFITACFLVTNTLANFLNIFWTPLYGGSLGEAAAKRGPLMPGPFFLITALVVVAAAVAFVFVGRQFERSQAEAAAAGVT